MYKVVVLGKTNIRLQQECLAASGQLRRSSFNSGVAHEACDVDRLTVRWRRPPVGWTKLNCDGAVVPSSGHSTCGGVVRNEVGGLTRIIVEVDSFDAINLIRQYKVGEASLALVPHIVSLINRNWTIELAHLREGNKLTDCMAKIRIGMAESHDSSLEGGYYFPQLGIGGF
ncbi:hypothetical protein GQ457_17G026260 [Hibiscus cannabinus]